METVQLLREVSQVGGNLLVSQGEKLVVGGIEDLLQSSFVKNPRTTSNDLGKKSEQIQIIRNNRLGLFEKVRHS